ncbi:MAG TPA: dihydrolipoyl dehydrogenase [Dehalococcoidia bacterium]|nr:dihydrolipoyl dehydrogenase [Dehalococcoidia bacterium]
MVVGQTGEQVDVLVVGGGPAGYSAAIRAAQLGRSVALVERSRIGGVCLNEGCIPSKAMLSASRLYRLIGRASVMGIDADPQLDFARLRAWKDGVVQRLSSGVSKLLERYKVEVKAGTAYFASPHRVSVDLGDRNEFIDFQGAIVATGSHATAGGQEFDGRNVLTPEQALSLAHLPPTVAIVGSDYVAVELATAFARLGSSVTLVAEAKTPLPELEPALGQAVARGLRELGVETRTGRTVRSYGKGKLTLSGGKSDAIAVEIVILAEGRAPSTEGLGLQEAGVHLDDGGAIDVDESCRTSSHTIFAAGDAVAGPMLADRAIAQGRVAAECLCGLPSAYDPAALPLAYFTEPEVMSAGLTEAAAREAGYETLSARFPFGASGRAATLAEQQGSVQVVAEKGTERVIGVHAAGPYVSELAGEATLALELGATLQDLALTIHPHPTLSEALPEAAWLALGAPLHVFRTAL